MVSVPQSPDNRHPKLVVADGRGAGPAAAFCYRVARHMGCIEARADLLTARADGAFANAPAITAGGGGGGAGAGDICMRGDFALPPVVGDVDERA